MIYVDRPLEIMAFLDHNHWADANINALGGDFSTRRYARLTKTDGATALLMDADLDQKTPQFVAIGKILLTCGLHVPKIFAAIPERGLVLMQDFGSTNVGALLDAGHDAKPYFLRAAEILAQMHQNFDATKITGLDLPTYSAELFTEQAELFVDAYFPLGCGREATEDEREDFRAAWMTVLRPLQNAPGSLLLRDFMPDNLMALDQNDLGVLDFQDAGMGPSGYDIASLCEEVRRDGGFALLPDVIDHYLERRGSEMASYDLLRTCTLLSAQRHTRIMGIIARMAIKADRRDKFVCLPRIKKHLLSVLCDPCLAPVRTWMQNCGALSNESY